MYKIICLMFTKNRETSNSKQLESRKVSYNNKPCRSL